MHTEPQQILKNFEFPEPTRYPWVCEITEQSAIDFHERIMAEFESNPNKPIVIHINSYGGSVDALFSMLSTMDAVRAMAPDGFQFVTVAHGNAQSAGAVLLSYGDIRCATEHSRIMLHQVIAGNWGSQPDNEIEFSEISRMNEKLLKVLHQRCRSDKTLKDFKDSLKQNLYLTPKQAQEFGLTDGVGYPKVIEQIHYEVVALSCTPEKETPRASRRTNKRTAKKKSKS